MPSNNYDNSHDNHSSSTVSSCACPGSPTGAHAWVLTSNRGPTSTGVCRYCNAVREFSNDPYVVPFRLLHSVFARTDSNYHGRIS